jgi:WD40 repeat protein
VRCRIRGQLTELVAQYTRIAFAPGGRFFALEEFMGYDQRKMSVSLWDTETGRFKHRFNAPAEVPGPLTFSPDGSRVAVGRSYTRLYDVTSGKELLSKPAHEGAVDSLAFTLDGGTLISGGADGMIAVWDAATGKGRYFDEANRWRGAVTGVALVPGSTRFVSCGLDGLIRLHDWRTGEEIRRFEEKPIQGGRARGVYDHYQFKEVRVSGDGRTVIGNAYTGKDDEGPFHSWDLATGKLLRNFPRQGDAEFFDLTADAGHFIGTKQLAPDHHAYAVEVREIAGDRQLFGVRQTDSRRAPLRDSAVTEDGRLLVHATTAVRRLKAGDSYENPTIRLWEMVTGKERLSIVSGQGVDCCYDTIALSPDSRALATARHDDTLQLWDLITGEELMRQSGYADPVTTMTFSPDGRFLATGHAGGTILVWGVPPPRRKPPRFPRPAEELASCWEDLAGADAARARAAISKLVEAPEQAVGLFQERLGPAKDESERIARLIARLDDDRFAAREAASNELERLGPEAEPALRRALGRKIAPEGRRRIENLLALSMQVRDPELLRGIRAVEVLEHIATPGGGPTRLAAIDLLKKLASGSPDARLTREARSALGRL